MSKKLTGKTVLVTGGGSGIGQSICLRMAQDGARVIILDLTQESAAATAEQVQALGAECEVYACDVANSQQVAQVLGEITQKYPINILINNAGIAHVGNIENTREEDLDRLYAVNVKGLYNTTLGVIASMKAQGSGIIINMASIASSVGLADRFAYSMSKGAVLSMTLSVAKDYLNDGIRCNCISPGRVHTPFVDNFIAKNYPDNGEEMFEKLSKSQPIGRMAQPEEVAGLVAYLCSEEAAFITGSNFPIDGGFITLNS
ncbi:SDR family oxidoreductase [Gilvimarinus agarilyticus]|uniref:SDR family NAD(P)-dependent oxidoreductase n=1 Tax=Gilvimarinus sp. 2_MG-2023 TaxID=3062666 RepID=UPI001C09985B|nr:SDR family oxidoreductase [Gilvimarinus sp. 2_MG-2023]MBU2887507.1 SDR family oxidoreductase [Gilvimarinus agarilyticus]MDO6572158.1 SDR family oxidoreductase [Gilvimarinus sp. 2_MG-2023]